MTVEYLQHCTQYIIIYSGFDPQNYCLTLQCSWFHNFIFFYIILLLLLGHYENTRRMIRLSKILCDFSFSILQELCNISGKGEDWGILVLVYCINWCLEDCQTSGVFTLASHPFQKNIIVDLTKEKCDIWTRFSCERLTYCSAEVSWLSSIALDMHPEGRGFKPYKGVKLCNLCIKLPTFITGLFCHFSNNYRLVFWRLRIWVYVHKVKSNQNE